MEDLLRILAVLALIAGNAFFVIGEYSVVTARRSALAPRAEAGSAGARAALRLMDDPVRVISTVQVGITAIGILTGAIGEPLVRDLLGDSIPTAISFIIAFAAVTYLSVVFGELVPKALTLDRAEALASLVARPVTWLETLFRPIVWALQGTAAVCLKPFGIREVTAGDAVRSADELRALVDEAEGSGVIPRAQEELLHNVFDFADREARDVMVPAPDVAWLDASLTPDQALDQIVTRPHARYPVGRGSLDHLAGIVLVHDLVAASRAGDAHEPIERITRPALVVPETKDLGALLRELREQRQHVAVVVGEYGTTFGLVSIEDVVEEIVGEIEDEFDLPDSTLAWQEDGSVEVAGSMTIDDFNETVHTDLPTDGPRTLAGLVFDALGRRPVTGDSIVVGGVSMHVQAVEGARITQLGISLPERDARRADSASAPARRST